MELLIKSAISPEGCRTGFDGEAPGEGDTKQRLIITVNYGPTQGQCYVSFPWDDLQGRKVILQDLMNAERYEREGDDLRNQGLYVDLPAWGFHVFAW